MQKFQHVMAAFYEIIFYKNFQYQNQFYEILVLQKFGTIWYY